MINDLNTVKDKVENILAKFPETQDDDKLLWIAIMVVFYDLKNVLGSDKYDKFKYWLIKNNIPAFESVRRVRQKYQEEGKYVGTKRKYKLEEESLVRDWTKS